MLVNGDTAKDFNAIRLDSLENANKGELVAADEDTGAVTYKDRAGENVTLALGPHAIKLLHR